MSNHRRFNKNQSNQNNLPAPQQQQQPGCFDLGSVFNAVGGSSIPEMMDDAIHNEESFRCEVAKGELEFGASYQPEKDGKDELQFKFRAPRRRRNQ